MPEYIENSISGFPLSLCPFPSLCEMTLAHKVETTQLLLSVKHPQIHAADIWTLDFGKIQMYTLTASWSP
jgi:hypothetical protein